MGKIYSSQNGVMRGRIGNTIYRKGQNATIAAQYQPQVANPKTLGQSVQRAVFATVSQALAGMRSIVNHSHYGVSGTRQNEQRFVEQNIAQLRGLVIGNVQGSVPFEGVLNLKGAKGIQPAPYIISEGTLAFPRVDAVTAAAAKLPLGTSLDLLDTILNQEDYENALRVLGLLPGEQISFVGIYDTATLTAQFEGSDGIVQNFGQVVYASRVTFVEELPADFDGDLVKQVSGQIYQFNPQIVARSEGEMRVTIDGTDTQHLVLGDGRQGNDDTLSCAAIVRSARDINGRFNYSNTQMYARPTSGTSFPRAINYVESYMAGASVELGERPFLNNPLQATTSTNTSGRGSGSAVLTPSSLPFIVSTESSVFNVQIAGATAAPTDVRLNFTRSGVNDGTSKNLVGLSVGAAVAAAPYDNITIVEATPIVSAEEVEVSIASTTADTICTGGYMIIGSQRYNF